MLRILTSCFFALLLFIPCSIGQADSLYPETLGNGNYVLVSAHQGVASYADRNSAVIKKSQPPAYMIAINVVYVTFSEAYWQKYGTYNGGPYTVGDTSTHYYLYNCENKKMASYDDSNGNWYLWDINRDHSYADGDPFIPHTAEVAFVSACKMRFYNDTMGYSPSLQQYHRVIDEDFYRRLNI